MNNLVSIEEVTDFFEWLAAEKKKTLILTHQNPDGDCIGSAYALCEILRSLGGAAEVSCADPLPRRLRFLARPSWESDDVAESFVTGLSEGDSRLEEYGAVISVDTASPVQLGSNEFLIPQIELMIDHHGIGEPYAKNYIDSSASAAGEIVFDIYTELKKRGKIPPIPEAARKMYAAIVSDTGSFKFSNTTKKTHIAASELLAEINSANDGGMDTSDVCRSLFGQRTMKELTAQMLAIQSLRFYEDGALGAVVFTQKMLADAGLTEEEIGNVVDTPRGVEGVLVGISLRQLSSDERVYKVSSRANAEIDCASVCAEYGGGGHVRAAGCTVEAESAEEALAIMAEAFGKAVREFKSKKK